MRVTDRHTVHGFFNIFLQLSYTDDFRGCLFVPDIKRHKVMEVEDVAIAVGYNNFNGKLCSMHAVIQDPSFVSRPIIREIFEFPFVTCGREHVIAPVESGNKEALDFDKRLGFKELYRFPDGAVEGDLVILGMSKKECRWIGKGKQNG